jgi:hypothetical protein
MRSPFVVTVDRGILLLAFVCTTSTYALRELSESVVVFKVSCTVFTAVAVAAKVLLVVLTESLSCTTPAAEVDAAETLMAGVVPPDETIGAVPVTLVTPPLAAAAHLTPLPVAESAVRT